MLQFCYYLLIQWITTINKYFSSRIQVKISLSVLIILLLAGCRLSYTKYPELAATGTDKVSAERCRECHTAIYEEWSTSPHSRAYSNQLFKELTNNYQITACLNCHAQESAFDQEPQLRTVFLSEGVQCQTCHLQEGKLQGPVEQHLPFNIHPIQEKNELYLKSDLCGKCHKKTFEEYQRSGMTKKTCQDCHMPAVTRTIIDDLPWVWVKSEFKFRRHTFEIKKADAIEGELTMSLTLNTQIPPTGRVVIKNVSIPHNIPTGAYGYHVLQLTLNLLDFVGDTEEKKTIYLTQELKTSIQPGETRIIDFAFEDEQQFPWGIQAILSKDSLDPAESRVLAEMVKLYQ